MKKYELRPGATPALDFETLSLATQSCYVWDLSLNLFSYIKPDNLFLCDHPIEEVLKQGDDFYRRIIHPEDLPLWIEMRQAAIRFLEDRAEKPGEIDHFCCSFRLQRKYAFLPERSFSQMIHHQMTPYWENGELRYLICSVSSSMAKETGNLRVYYKESPTYHKYNLTTRRWRAETKISLTEREEAILMLYAQGKCKREIAIAFDKGESTIQNQCKTLLSCLNVNSMSEAIEYVRHHRIIGL